jgi:cytochrome P450
VSLDHDAAALDPAIVTQMLPFDPFDADFRTDPYPVYRRLRESAPIVRTPAGTWAVTRHQDCSAILRDPRFGWGDGLFVADQFTTDPDGNVVRPFIFMDPPDHTRIRTLVSRAFTPRVVERLRPRAEQVAAALFADAVKASADGAVDLVSAVAHPLPAVLLAELLGVPADNHEQFRQWSNAIGRGLDPFVLTFAEMAERDQARTLLDEYFTELADRRRAEPGDDLVSALVEIEQEGDRLTATELVTTVRLLLSAGFITTVHWIANGTLALLRNPEQFAWLQAHPERAGDAAEELLRYDAPIQMVSRVALAETELGGDPITPGEPLLLLLASGNRDPEAYPDPDRLDLSRAPGRNLAFGLGPHFCVGAPIARLTAQVAFTELARHDVELVEANPPVARTFLVRGLAELPVRLQRR